MLGLALAACGPTNPISSGSSPETAEATVDSADTLSSIIAGKSEQIGDRIKYRNPQQTLEFFGVQPGMTVIEVLPGRGWYSQILAPYLGEEGTLHAVNYADTMWPMFGFFDAETIAARKQQMVDWPTTVVEHGGAAGRGFAFGNVPEDLNGTADAILFFRAVHNLNRFEAKANTRSDALVEAFALLKSGGIAGVVQHRAPDDAADKWADGSAGYLKQSSVIAMFEEAGFKFDGSSEVNANAKDQPTDKDVVWRLPPSFSGSKEDPEKKSAMEAIGESDRMTLRFVKP